MKKCINEMFNLQGFLIDKIENTENRISVHCRNPRKFVKCPKCLCSTKNIHQNKEREVKHSKLAQKTIIIALKYRRFKCKNCKAVFTEKLLGINRKRTTVGFRKEILNWLARNSFNYIGKQFNLAPSTLVNYLRELNNDLKIDWDLLKITKLGVDEHSFCGRNLIITITDLSNHRLLAILKSDSLAALKTFIYGIPEEVRKNIEEVCIDLKSGYKSTIKECLPKASIVADRFHVETLARRTVDSIRSVIQEDAPGSRMNLKKILWVNKEKLNDYELKKLEKVWKKYEHYPVLKQAYTIKEKLIFMYRASSKEEAERRFKHVIMLIETHDYNCRYLNTLRKTLNYWKNQILNYWNSKTTNGFTEGCHTKIKMIKRVSFGFRNIDNYIAKMMLAFLPLTVYLDLPHLLT